MTFLDQRRREPERMDDPALPADQHEAALRGLARLNALSRGTGILWGALRPLFPRFRDRPLRVLDLATGGGDALLGLAARACRAGALFEWAGCDVSETALAVARKRAEAAGIKAEWFALDALRDPLPTGFDVVTCSLFMHHLDDEPAQAVLAKMHAAARAMTLVGDLERSIMNYGLVWLGSRLVTRSPIVHVDGPLSVQAAFTAEELRRLATASGLESAVVTRHFPCRLRLAALK